MKPIIVEARGRERGKKEGWFLFLHLPQNLGERRALAANEKKRKEGKREGGNWRVYNKFAEGVRPRGCVSSGGGSGGGSR